MIGSLSFRISVLGIVVAVALLGLVGLLVDASARTNESFGSVTRSAEIIETMDQALVELRDAESGQRGFVLTRNAVFAQDFEERVTQSRMQMARVVDLTLDDPTQNAQARRLGQLIDRRILILREPLNLARQGRFDAARDIVALGRSRDVMTAVTVHAQTFLDSERLRQRSRIEAAGQRLSRLKELAIIGGPLIAILKLFVSGFIVRRIRQPVRVIRSAMAEFGRGNRQARIEAAMGSIEFEQLAHGYNVMAGQLEEALSDQSRSERELQEANATLRDRGEVIELLGAMAHRMQAARTDDELAKVLRVFVPRVLPGIDGALYTHDRHSQALTLITAWGSHEASVGFAPDQCWALRRGQSHFVTTPGSDIVCEHVRDQNAVYHCEPLLAGGEMIGTLHLRGVVEAENRFRLAVMVENIASALVNHRLQRGLREQTIRDPLTTLFNRRHMEEVLAAEISRAAQLGTPLSVAMCDVDHFKRFNDEYGHDAGDTVLRTVAEEMRSRFREGDVVCRFGGEEFAVIAPGTSATNLSERVEAVRRAIAEMQIRYSGQVLGQTCMSFGIASWTEQMGRDALVLVQAADAALYRAKREGRNRTVLSLADAA